ncbi:ABC transporter ATP-binding protein [Verrucomicrobia bacterium]|nr:ABC transporter ATP-binding protein [Verrucomicrobiota bacterium]MDC0219313.1 ABC transporter ATP-binding protein [Verrucomicrobiota bacterium]
MTNATSLLQLKNISREFPSTEGGTPLEVLRSLSMDVARGESIAIIGPSGCGKSTLLNLIGTLDQPTDGAIAFDGRDLIALNDDELALLRNREMGFIFQNHHLLPQCTVIENVLVPTLAHGRATNEEEERARHLLNRVGLGERLSHRPSQLSGGERQRVAVVRALINKPQLLLADEPTGALDQTTADQLGQLLVELNAEENVTLITVTHSAKLAGRMARTVELKDGQIA